MKLRPTTHQDAIQATAASDALLDQIFSPGLAEAIKQAPGRGRHRIIITALLPNVATLLNRDLAGMAKQIPFGDAVRERTSSQWFKARTRDLVYGGASLSTIASVHGLGRSIRSRHIFPVLVKARLLKSIGDAAGAWSQALSDLFVAEKPEAESNAGAADGAAAAEASAPGKPDEPKAAGKKAVKSRSEVKRDQGIEEHGEGFLSQPIVLGDREIDVVAQIAETMHGKGIKPEELRTVIAEAGKSEKSFTGKYGERLGDATKLVYSAVASLRATGTWAGIDAVLYGRFITSDLVTRLDPAVHVAHGIGVIALAKAIDFFSVRDQIVEDGGTAHINNTEVTTSLRHQHLVIDLDQMWTNLGPSAAADAIADLVCWLVGVTAGGVPGAKLGGTAPYQAAEGMVVEIGRHTPRSHVGAFVTALQPKRGENLYQIARERLAAYIAEKDAEHGAPERRFATACMPLEDAQKGSVAEICAALRAWIMTEWVSPDDRAAAAASVAESAAE